MNKNNDLIDAANWAGLLGSILLPVGARVADYAFGGGIPIFSTLTNSLVGTTALAGIGQRIGSEFGEHEGDLETMFTDEGGVIESDQLREEFLDVGFAGDYRDQLIQSLDESYGGWDESQWEQSLSTAQSAFILGGGLGTAQTMFAGDGNLWSKFVGTAIEPYKFNPFALAQQAQGKG